MPNLLIEDYLKQVKSSMRGLNGNIDKAFGVISNAKANGRRVLCLGNGGSLAIAQHFAQDLLKLCRVRAWTINCPSILTAHANDDGFEMSFYNPAMKLLDPGDPIFIFSCSGKSRNYKEFFNELGDVSLNHPIVSIVGTDGGFLKKKSKVSIHIESNDYQICEAAFVIVSDLIVKRMMED